MVKWTRDKFFVFEKISSLEISIGPKVVPCF